MGVLVAMIRFFSVVGMYYHALGVRLSRMVA